MSDSGKKASNRGAHLRDDDTAARLRARDPEGLRQLFEDHGGIVRARLRQSFGKLLDASDLEEVLEMTSIRVWYAKAGFDPALGTLRAWVSVLAKRSALRLLDARRRLRSREEARDLEQMSLPTSAASAPLSAQREELFRDAMICMRGLPRMQRTVLMADLAAGRPADARPLAQRLSTSVDSIYVSRHRGRRTLRQALIDLGHEPDAFDRRFRAHDDVDDDKELGA